MNQAGQILGIGGIWIQRQGRQMRQGKVLAPISAQLEWCIRAGVWTHVQVEVDVHVGPLAVRVGRRCGRGRHCRWRRRYHDPLGGAGGHGHRCRFGQYHGHRHGRWRHRHLHLLLGRLHARGIVVGGRSHSLVAIGLCAPLPVMQCVCVPGFSVWAYGEKTLPMHALLIFLSVLFVYFCFFSCPLWSLWPPVIGVTLPSLSVLILICNGLSSSIVFVVLVLKHFDSLCYGFLCVGTQSKNSWLVCIVCICFGLSIHTYV